MQKAVLLQRPAQERYLDCRNMAQLPSCGYSCRHDENRECDETRMHGTV